MLSALGCVGHGELVPSHALWCLITVLCVCHCPAMLCEHCAPSLGHLRLGVPGWGPLMSLCCLGAPAPHTHLLHTPSVAPGGLQAN